MITVSWNEMIDSGFLIIDFNPNFMLFKKSTKFKGAGDLFWGENQLLRLKRLKTGVNKFWKWVDISIQLN